MKEGDLRGMGHNSSDYLHHLIEAMKLGFADRDTYYGDPDFVDVPLDRLRCRHRLRRTASAPGGSE